MKKFFNLGFKIGLMLGLLSIIASIGDDRFDLLINSLNNGFAFFILYYLPFLDKAGVYLLALIIPSLIGSIGYLQIMKLNNRIFRIISFFALFAAYSLINMYLFFYLFSIS
jgi:hypothetical protein